MTWVRCSGHSWLFKFCHMQRKLVKLLFRHLCEFCSIIAVIWPLPLILKKVFNNKCLLTVTGSKRDIIAVWKTHVLPTVQRWAIARVWKRSRSSKIAFLTNDHSWLKITGWCCWEMAYVFSNRVAKGSILPQIGRCCTLNVDLQSYSYMFTDMDN